MMAPPWAVKSPMRACGMLMVSTVNDPSTITSGGPTQTAISVTRAAGRPPISTVGAPGATMGPPTCGTKTVTMGQTCMSVNLAAGLPILSLLPQFDFHGYFHALRHKVLKPVGRVHRIFAHCRIDHCAAHCLGGQEFAGRYGRY